jgi:putative pyruvate formate lyase activating enzyme
MKKAGDLLAYFFDQKTLDSMHTWSKLFAAWPSIVAKHKISAAESHTRVVEFDRRVLLIEAEHPGWIQILQLKQSELLREFRVRFPELDIVGISFRLSKTLFTPVIQAPETPPAPAPLVDREAPAVPSSERSFEQSMKRLERSICAREQARARGDFNKPPAKGGGGAFNADVWSGIKHCRLCPRGCGADRGAGERGWCGESGSLRLAAVALHRGEEPPVAGAGGSGAVFVSGCSLGCVFCQNSQISQEGMGREVSIPDFAALCLKLQALGAENINIVTGTHAIPALAAGLAHARERGLAVPILWNSSAYESLEALALLENVVDGYLPDLKTLDPDLSSRLFNAPDYPEHAAKAVLRMMEARALSFSPESVLRSGVIIRHLVLPGHLESTREVLRWFAEHGQGRALLSLMTQYTPPSGAGERAQAAPKRLVSKRDYEIVLGWLEEFGIEDGFYQEPPEVSGPMPDFTQENPFPPELAAPVWHFQSL